MDPKLGMVHDALAMQFVNTMPFLARPSMTGVVRFLWP